MKINKNLLRFYPIPSGMCCGVCSIAVWWTMGLALPLVTFVLAIATGVSYNLKPEDPLDNHDENVFFQRMFSPLNTLVNLVFLMGMSLVPLFNIPRSFGMADYWFWPKITLCGFFGGLGLYAVIRLFKTAFVMAKRSGSNLVAV